MVVYNGAFEVKLLTATFTKELGIRNFKRLIAILSYPICWLDALWFFLMLLAARINTPTLWDLFFKTDSNNILDAALHLLSYDMFSKSTPFILDGYKSSTISGL